MHLSANVILGWLLPSGTTVRRNFTFEPGEKSWLNRLYRRAVDRLLAERHPMTDLFYSLLPLEPRSRIEKILGQARDLSVELETHPVNQDEFRFLAEGGIFRCGGDALTIATCYSAGTAGRRSSAAVA
jgi:hypothetical protein